MGLFEKIFGTSPEQKKYFSESETEQRNEEFTSRLERAKTVLTRSLEIYNANSCQCAYPRFQQIISIDCSDTGNSFKCYDTDLLIDLAKKYFDMEESQLKDESANEKWTCKTCRSTYEYGWSDFSIQVERQKLKLTNLTIPTIGKAVRTPIPLYLGLMGHSLPPKSEMTNVDFIEFERYMTEN